MHRLSVLLGIAFMLTGGAAQAAPQILGLVASAQPTELHCRDGVCSARFTSFCLQQGRDAPMLGTAYQPVDGGALQLVLTDGEGRATSVPAGDVAIRSVHNYTIVEIAVPEDRVRALGGVKAALAVAPRATLVPVEAANDPAPHSAAEIARASGSYRAVGETHVDRGGATAEVAGVLMTMINALHARETGNALRDAARDGALAHAILADQPVAASQRESLRERVYLCGTLANNAWYRDGMSACLESYHDSYVSTLTGRYWDAVGTGF